MIYVSVGMLFNSHLSKFIIKGLHIILAKSLDLLDDSHANRIV